MTSHLLFSFTNLQLTTLHSLTHSLTHSLVTPLPDEMQGSPGPDLSTLPKYIKSHRQSNDVTCFFYQRPFRKNKIKSANEFLDLWVEKKFLMTSVNFPGHTRRAEVTKEGVLVLNPIEMAVIGLEERNGSLKEECEEMKSMKDRMAAQSYTMSLRCVWWRGDCELLSYVLCYFWLCCLAI